MVTRDETAGNLSQLFTTFLQLSRLPRRRADWKLQTLNYALGESQKTQTSTSCYCHTEKSVLDLVPLAPDLRGIRVSSPQTLDTKFHHVIPRGFPLVCVCPGGARPCREMASVPLINLLDSLLQKAYHDLNILQEL
jgi:hypothetical protein